MAIKDETKTPTRYITVSTIVNNLSYENSKMVHDILIPTMKSFINPPSYLDFGVYKPDVYIEPSDSVVLEIKASELQKSSSVTPGFILRFPRVTAIRRDKPPTDCCDVQEYRNLCGIDEKTNKKVVKLPKRHATASDLQNAHKRAPKRQKIETNTFVNRYRDLPEVEVIDEIAKGLQIAVLNSGKGKNFPSKEELELLVRQHGGQVVANPGRNTNFCVAHIQTPIVQSIIQSKSQTIVTISWFLKAFSGNHKELIDITRKDTICMKPDFEAGLKYKYDLFNDHYTKELSDHELKEQLKEMVSL